MQKFKNIEEAFASQNFDTSKIVIEGIPEHHKKAVEAFAKLCVASDAVNATFQPDFKNFSQRKYNPIFVMGSSSGVGFAYGDCGDWGTASHVGSRLCSESEEACKHLAKIGKNEYKEMMVYKRKIQ